ncbi:hypothetical protein [Sporosarcina sp.]|uniref:hypothetical protein n=1 Tax=Sporosarcina sp. TaxID=49982 RepID=UPI0026041F51|nr:hypothetical protein [Sporosarcina sp.]
MTKKNMWIFSSGLLLVASLCLFYWFYLAKPVTFPDDQQLIYEMNDVFPQVAVEVIQDKIHADEHHVVVPFISEKQQYGLSYWMWKKHKWQVLHIDLGGEPRVWKVNPQDPSSYHFVWNISPAEKLSAIQLYMLRERGLRFSEEEETYEPRVQIEWKILLQDQPYGLMPLPDEGVKILKAYTNVSAARKLDLLFSFPEPEVYFSWIAKDVSGNEAFPTSIMNSNSYSVNYNPVDYMLIYSEDQLEMPDRN